MISLRANLYLPCPSCSTVTEEELEFCLNCGHRLIPKTLYDLEMSDFAYEQDLVAMQTIMAAGFLPFALQKLTVSDFETKTLSKLMTDGSKVDPKSEVGALVRHSAALLCLETLPDILTVEGNLQGVFTFGSGGRSYLVLTSAALKLLTASELTALVGHELGHVKSGHIVYHTLAEALAKGLGASASFLGLGDISFPLRMALLEWHRESEVTADRAGLLVAGNIQSSKSLLTKVMISAGGGDIQSVNPNASPADSGLIASVSELFRTHPTYSSRLSFLEQFSQSNQFVAAKRKMERRQSLRRALIPFCRFCGAPKAVQDMFCPKCHKSHT
jgi:Zn-dependent protease with chaperone function